MLASDFQIPYQDDRAVDLWWQVMKYFKPHVVDYLGDVSDQFCFSRFNEGTTTEFLNKIQKDDDKASKMIDHIKAEETLTAELYKKTRKMRPNSEIFAALGNHDIRVWTYVDKKIPEILHELTPEALWGLDNLGIDYIHYEDVPKHRYGDLYAHHGIATSKHSGQSVMADISDLGVSIIRGHSHRLGSYYKTHELRNETLRGYEIGHLCKVDSDGFKYSQVHNWQQGFAVGIIEDGKRPHIQLVEITQDYTCYIGQRKFSA